MSQKHVHRNSREKSVQQHRGPPLCTSLPSRNAHQPVTRGTLYSNLQGRGRVTRARSILGAGLRSRHAVNMSQEPLHTGLHMITWKMPRHKTRTTLCASLRNGNGGQDETRTAVKMDVTPSQKPCLTRTRKKNISPSAGTNTFGESAYSRYTYIVEVFVAECDTSKPVRNSGYYFAQNFG